MKKFLVFVILTLLAASTAYAVSPSNITSPISHLVRWTLNTNNNTYNIPNPSHTQLNFIIELWPHTSDDAGKDIDSSPIQLNCGNTVTKLSIPNTPTATCTTTDNISFKTLASGNQASQGEFTVSIQ